MYLILILYLKTLIKKIIIIGVVIVIKKPQKHASERILEMHRTMNIPLTTVY